MKFSVFVIGLTVLAVTSAEPQRSWDWLPRSTGPTRLRSLFGGYRLRRSPDSADHGFSTTWINPLSGESRFGREENLMNSFVGEDPEEIPRRLFMYTSDGEKLNLIQITRN